MRTQNKIYSTLAFFILISLLLIVFLIYPTLMDIKKGSSKILSNREKIAFIYMQQGELDSFEENFEEYKPNLNAIEKVFIDPQNPVGFIKFLENVSSNLGIAIEINLTPSIKDKTNDDSLSSLRIYAKSDFQKIVEFSEKLEAGPYLLQINRLSINKVTDGAESPKNSNAVEANFSVQVMNKQ